MIEYRIAVGIVTFCVSRRRREKYIGYARLCVCLCVCCLSVCPSPYSHTKSVGLVWGLAATQRSVCVHQMNRVNSRSDHGHEDSTINTVVDDDDDDDDDDYDYYYYYY